MASALDRTPWRCVGYGRLHKGSAWGEKQLAPQHRARTELGLPFLARAGAPVFPCSRLASVQGAEK